MSLVLSARDPARDMSIARTVPLERVLDPRAPRPATLHGVSEFVRNELLPRLHVEQSFVEGRTHALLLPGETGPAGTAEPVKPVVPKREPAGRRK